ncbi:hypothetical protein N0V93_007299 [Gnomoniopsis smithogilvyi]|uniref:CENP-V/GFA domain-containing protein n=1 Tax=Gnomoniopsis smithogilvyi TaxID=1191159 RepID=A0A9W9CWI6_9PEZI|nr:hypothetical protein N0V93_007299 [Gnomoniopsis smithogilvyi]
MAEGDLKTYRGNCHCGKFIYEIKVPEIKEYNECNCSICRRKGYAFVIPGEGNFQFVKGSMDELKTYSFGNQYFTHCVSRSSLMLRTKVLDSAAAAAAGVQLNSLTFWATFQFCPDCGTAILGDCPQVTPSIFINARAIQGLDIWSLKSKTFDGNALAPPYKPPVYDGPEPSMEVENGKVYYGSCHCGAVRLALKVKPFETWDTLSDEESVVECNCSSCVRGAQVWCYPHKDQSVILGRENISYHIFNTKTGRKGFCKHCGVPLFNEENPPKEFAALSDDAKKSRESVGNQCNINLRILQDFDYKTLKTLRLDGAGDIPGGYVDP